MTSDDTQNQSSEEQPKVFEKMPEFEEFKTLNSETQRQLIDKFGVPQDNDEEKSETSEQESSAETADQPKEEEKAQESEVKDTPVEEPVKEKEAPELEKKYKALEAEFTRRSQKLRDLERKVEELAQGKDGQVAKEEVSPLDKLAADNPKAKDLIDAFRAELDSRLQKGIKPIQETLSQKVASENFAKFSSEVKAFLSSPLGKMEQEFNDVAAEIYGSQDALQEAAYKDPALFTKLQKEVLSRHFVKAARLMEDKPSPEEKNKVVKQTGVSGKSRTVTEVDDQLDLKVFKGLSSEDMKKVLSKHGAVKN